MALTIDEIKTKRIELEKELTEMFKSFEEETGTRVSYPNIRREEPKKNKSDSPESVMPDYDYDDRTIITVDLELRFMK